MRERPPVAAPRAVEAPGLPAGKKTAAGRARASSQSVAEGRREGARPTSASAGRTTTEATSGRLARNACTSAAERVVATSRDSPPENCPACTCSAVGAERINSPRSRARRRVIYARAEGSGASGAILRSTANRVRPDPASLPGASAGVSAAAVPEARGAAVVGGALGARTREAILATYSSDLRVGAPPAAISSTARRSRSTPSKRVSTLRRSSFPLPPRNCSRKSSIRCETLDSSSYPMEADIPLMECASRKSVSMAPRSPPSCSRARSSPSIRCRRSCDSLTYILTYFDMSMAASILRPVIWSGCADPPRATQSRRWPPPSPRWGSDDPPSRPPPPPAAFRRRRRKLPPRRRPRLPAP